LRPPNTHQEAAPWKLCNLWHSGASPHPGTGLGASGMPTG
jgi:hypothetical protein